MNRSGSNKRIRESGTDGNSEQDMHKFTVATQDLLWPTVLRKYAEITSSVENPTVPDREMAVNYMILAVGEAGKSIDGVRSGRAILEIDTVKGDPVYASAQEHAAEHGGMPNLGRVAIRITGITLSNVPVPVEGGN